MRGRRPDVPKTRQRSEEGGGWLEEVRVVAPAGCQHYAALGERTEEEGDGWSEEVGVAALASRCLSIFPQRHTPTPPHPAHDRVAPQGYTCAVFVRTLF